MRLTFLFFISCIVISCHQVVMEKDVLRKDGKVILRETKRAFTGDVISKFQGGNVSSKFSYENGALLGKWYTKGFEGEIIQEGEYISCDNDLLAVIKKETGKDFCLLSLWKEDTNTFVTLDIECSKVLPDSFFLYINNKYLKRYDKRKSEIRVLNGDSILVTKTYEH